MKIDERWSKTIDKLSCNKAKVALKILMLNTAKSHTDVTGAIDTADSYTSTTNITDFFTISMSSSALKKWELFMINSRVAASAIGMDKSQWIEYVEETMNHCDIDTEVPLTVNNIIDDMKRYMESVN